MLKYINYWGRIITILEIVGHFLPKIRTIDTLKNEDAKKI